MENRNNEVVTVTETISVSEGTGMKQEKVTKEAWLVAASILLGSLIVAGALITLGVKMASLPPVAAPAPTPTTAQQPPTPNKVAVTLDQVKALFTDKNLSFGNKNSKVLFVEFSDPSCPYCHVAAGKNPELNKQIGSQFTMAVDGGSYVPPVPEMKKMVDAGKAAFVWIYANGHGSGEMGTRALYCAKEQGKFWQVHDQLMSSAGYALINGDLKNDKAKAGVLADFLKDVAKAGDMKSCLESGRYDSRITDDMAMAKQFGFNGTPSFFVGTDNFGGAYNFKDMQATVDKYLK